MILTFFPDNFENILITSIFALLFSGGYEGNPMQVHKNLHTKSPMTMQHFQRWNQLFSETVDDMYAGEKAELIKQRALSIAMVIQIHLFK